MAIGNVTPDSFYASSRLMNPSSEQVDEEGVLAWAKNALSEGADILDIGACSTRPGSTPVEEAEEWRRLQPALRVLRKNIPEVQLSLDTFRPEIARLALENFGPMIINDISGGCPLMYDIVRSFEVPYVWTLRGNLDWPLQKSMDGIHLILDPGFGFCGGVEQDYECLRGLDSLRAFNRPILVGVSRKSMLWKPLGLTPDTCLCATQALQLYALEHGAAILRTHDVRATRDTITIWNNIRN